MAFDLEVLGRTGASDSSTFGHSVHPRGSHDRPGKLVVATAGAPTS